MEQVPPNRINNPMAALEMLSRSEWWLSGVLWYVPPASDCSNVTRKILWSMELLQADLEEEFQASCRRHLDDNAN